MSQGPPSLDSSDLLSEADLDLLLQGLGGAGGVASIFDHVIATGGPPPAVLQHFAEHGGLPSFAPVAIRNQVNEMAAAVARTGGGCAAPAIAQPTPPPHIQAEGTAEAAAAVAAASVAVNPPRRMSRRVRTAARARSAGPVISSDDGAGSGAGSGGGASSPSAAASANAARKRKPRTHPRRPAATTQAARAHKKARTHSRTTGSSTTYERRRRARVGELMQTLTKLLFPAEVVDSTSDECHSVGQSDADTASRRKVRKPTKTDVLAAAVHTIRRASSSPQALVDPDPDATVVSAPRSGTFPEDPMQQVAIGARVFQSMVAEFQRPHSREIVAMVFRLAEEQYDDDLKHEANLQRPTPKGAPRSSSPTSKPRPNGAAVTAAGRSSSRDSGAQRRIAVVSRIFRLCLPIIFRVCASHGLYNLLSLSELLTYFRQLFNLPQCREALGQIRCLWIAPQLLASPPDQVPKDRMLAALRQIWREMSREDFRARVPALLSDVTGIAMAMDRMLPYIYPMWEDGAESLGFPRSLEGVARFHRSATTFDDPEIIELSWRCVGSVPEVLRDWLRHRVSEVDAEAGSFLEMPEVATPVFVEPPMRESQPPLR